MGQNTLEDVARLFGCTASQLSRYERGKRPVPAQSVFDSSDYRNPAPNLAARHFRLRARGASKLATRVAKNDKQGGFTRGKRKRDRAANSSQGSLWVGQTRMSPPGDGKSCNHRPLVILCAPGCVGNLLLHRSPKQPHPWLGRRPCSSGTKVV